MCVGAKADALEHCGQQRVQLFPFWESLGVCSVFIQEAVSPWTSRMDKIDAEEQAGEALALHSHRVSRASLSGA